KHAHVIGRCAIHSPDRCGRSAPDVSAANYNRDLYPEFIDFLDPVGDFAHHGRRNIFSRTALLQRFTAELEHDAFVSRRLGLHRRANETRGYRSWKAKTRFGRASVTLPIMTSQELC